MNFSKLTAYLDSLKSVHAVPGLEIQITKDHRVIYRHMTGHSDYAGKVPVSEADLYLVYSCTKVMTMIAVMQLVEQGKLDLYDPLEKYIPEYARMHYVKDYVITKPPHKWPAKDAPTLPATKKILIHQLMSMTAGFSYDTASAAAFVKPEYSTAEAIAAIAKMPLLFEPGDHYLYSLCHDVLAGVVEVVSGMRFRDYLKTYVFDPVDAKDMYFRVPESQQHRLSAQYSTATGQRVPCPRGLLIQMSDEYDAGGAGLYCTVSSYSKVIDALACGGVAANGARILTEESIRTMRQDWLNETQLEDFKKMEKIGYSYGLGVRTLVDGNAAKSPVGEFGWDGAAGAYCAIDPIHHVSIFYAQQVLDHAPAGSEIHPTIRDLAFEALEL